MATTEAQIRLARLIRSKVRHIDKEMDELRRLAAQLVDELEDEPDNGHPRRDTDATEAKDPVREMV